MLSFILGMISCSDDEPTGPPKEVINNSELHDNTEIRKFAATQVAPNMTRVLTENYNVLIYELTIESGDTLPYHEHAFNTYYIIEGGTVEVLFNDSTSEIKEFKTGDTGIGEPIGDMTINRGETTIKMLIHEFYSLTINDDNSTYSVSRVEAAFNVANNMAKIKHDGYGIVVYELIIEPGETLPYHEHAYHSFYILDGGTLEVIPGNGSSGKTSEYPEGRVGLNLPFGDIAINRGETSVKILLHEIYSLNPQ